MLANFVIRFFTKENKDAFLNIVLKNVIFLIDGKQKTKRGLNAKLAIKSFVLLNPDQELIALLSAEMPINTLSSCALDVIKSFKFLILMLTDIIFVATNAKLRKLFTEDAKDAERYFVQAEKIIGIAPKYAVALQLLSTAPLAISLLEFALGT